MTDRPGLVRWLTAPNPSLLTGMGTNTYLVGTTDIAVIDPGPDLATHHAAILENVGRRGRISHIIVTHAHCDHSALARQLGHRTGAPVLAFGDAHSGRSARMTAIAASLAPANEGLDLDFQPEQTLRDGDRITGPDWELEVHHTPGHLGGHVCLALGETLFSGDHVMGWSTTIVAPPDGDMTDYMVSLYRLAGSRWQRFLPGHGGPVEDPAERLAALIRHRQSREAAILDALASGPARIRDLAARIYHDTPAPLLPAAARNIPAHLIDLEARNLVLASPSLQPDAVYSRL